MPTNLHKNARRYKRQTDGRKKRVLPKPILGTPNKEFGDKMMDALESVGAIHLFTYAEQYQQGFPVPPPTEPVQEPEPKPPPTQPVVIVPTPVHQQPKGRSNLSQYAQRFQSNTVRRPFPPSSQRQPHDYSAPSPSTDAPAPSPPLKEMPERIVIVTDKNFAGIGDKLKHSLESVGFEVHFLNTWTPCDNTNHVFRGKHDKILVVYYDPGNKHGRSSALIPGIKVPSDIPWALYHGSSYYRVDNFVLEMATHNLRNQNNILPSQYMMNAGNITISAGKMRRANEYFDSLTPLVMVGTEDLLAMNPKSVFLGQPQYPWLDFRRNVLPNKIGHISCTPQSSGDTKKGTNYVRKAFREINFMKTEIVGYNSRLEHEACMKFIDSLGMLVCTMTTWDYGLGYVGLEAMSKSILALSRNSIFADNIKSEVIDVRSPKDVAQNAKYYMDNIDEFHAKRQKQWEWGREHFTDEAIGERFMAIVQNAIDRQWSSVDLKFRRL